MLEQPPKAVEAKTKVQINLPSFTQQELDHLLDPAAIDQELKAMQHKGIMVGASFKVEADIIDVVRWQDSKESYLKGLKKQDTEDVNSWVDELLEDLITYEVSPASSEEEAKELLKHLDDELELKEQAGFGPDARNYMVKLRAEIKMLTDKFND